MSVILVLEDMQVLIARGTTNQFRLNAKDKLIRLIRNVIKCLNILFIDYRCSNGYFGNPLSIGDFCRPCDCNGNADPYHSNWCDHRTGECLQCLGNTAGWKCDECVEGYYGNPLSGECKG